MQNRQVTIQVPLPENFDDDYELTGEFRRVCCGEHYLYFHLDGSVSILRNTYIDTKTDSSHFIVKKKIKYEWPMINGEPMKGWGFAKDKDGVIYFYNAKPRKNGLVWFDGNTYNTNIINAEALKELGIPIPEIPNWEKPVLNPYYKGDC